MRYKLQDSIEDQVQSNSGKRYHIFDTKTEKYVFHTDKRQRAEKLIELAGTMDITQHLKDYGHLFTCTGESLRCDTCKRF